MRIFGKTHKTHKPSSFSNTSDKKSARDKVKQTDDQKDFKTDLP